MNELLQGLTISILGILITFAFLGALILVIVLLREIFKMPHEEVRSEIRETDERNVLLTDQDNDRLKALAAAVAVATLKADLQSDPRLGQALENPPGRWWQAPGKKEP